MKKILFLISMFLVLSFNPLYSVDLDNPLPNSLTKSEKELINNNFDKYLQGKYKQYDSLRINRKPTGIFHSPGEFEKCEGICFSWTGYTTLLTKLIVEASKNVKVFIGVSPYDAENLKSRLISAGANGENLRLIKTRLDSVWMRDFGPFFIYTKSGDREIIDCLYNRPRPNDDKFPSTIGQKIGVKVHQCRLILPGGNFMTDGHGVAIMTNVVFDPSEGGDPNMTVAQLEKYMKDYFGIKKVILIKKMNHDGTGHVDMFAKLLDDRHIIVGEYAKPEDGYRGNYKILNDNAKKLATETNGLGEKFIITRIPMPKYSHGVSYTHTNSTIINKKVFVPVYGGATDKAALAVYKKILPDHKIIGFDCNRIIGANGAIHCITKLVMADPLDIRYTKTKEILESGENFFIKFNIVSERKIVDSEVALNWGVSKDGPFKRVVAKKFSKEGGLYTVSIKIPDNVEDIYYFMDAETNDGLYETSPDNAPENLHHCKVVRN